MKEYVKIPNIFKRETFGKNRLLEGTYSTPELETLSGIEWEWTEKVDGTNIRVIWNGYRVSFAGRTDNAQLPPHLLRRLEELFASPEKEEIFESLFHDKEAILCGEGFGEKIQKGGGLYGPVDFILFDVMELPAGENRYLHREGVEEVARILGIRTVPVVGHGTLPEAVEFIKTHPKSLLRDAEMEGVVCRPKEELFDRYNNRIIVKVKCRDFQKEALDEHTD